MDAAGGTLRRPKSLVRLRGSIETGNRAMVLLLPGMEGGTFGLAPMGQMAWRGFGEVWAAELPYESSIEGCARTLMDAMKGQWPGQACHELLVVGFSIGGLIGLELAHCLEDQAITRAKGVALVGSLPQPWHGRNRDLSTLLARLPDNLYRRLHHAKMRQNMRREGIPEEAVIGMLSPGPAASATRARLQAVRNWRGPRRPTCPVLWIRGKQDREARWSIGKVKQSVPWATFIETEGGHWPQWTHAAALERALGGVW